MKNTNNLKSVKKFELIKIIRNYEKGIRLNCFDCMGHQKRIDCELTTCSLYPFRPWAKNNKNLEDKQTHQARK